jgi:hypothetical protein
MRRIPKKYGHYLFGILQSAITCAVATGISTFNAVPVEQVAHQWASSWAISWILMIPVVLFAAPFLRKFVDRLTA